MILSNIRRLNPSMPTPPLVPSGAADIDDAIYEGLDQGGFFADLFSPSSSDVIDQYMNDSDFLFDKLIEVTEMQNKQAQASADRAMDFNAFEAAINRQWQEQQNQKAMDFSERMSNTSYQRAMADLKAAGLNPKLVGQLSGASTPAGISSSGSVASGSPASIAVANLAPMSSVLSTYITGADALDRQNRAFVQSTISALLKLLS